MPIAEWRNIDPSRPATHYVPKITVQSRHMPTTEDINHVAEPSLKFCDCRDRLVESMEHLGHHPRCPVLDQYISELRSVPRTRQPAMHRLTSDRHNPSRFNAHVVHLTNEITPGNALTLEASGHAQFDGALPKITIARMRVHPNLRQRQRSTLRQSFQPSTADMYSVDSARASECNSTRTVDLRFIKLEPRAIVQSSGIIRRERLTHSVGCSDRYLKICTKMKPYRHNAARCCSSSLRTSRLDDRVRHYSKYQPK